MRQSMQSKWLEVLCWWLLLTVFLPCVSFGQTTGIPFPESRYVTIQGAEVHYRYFPSGDTVSRGSVLLVHGFAGSTFSWRHVFDTLQSIGYEVIAVDLPPYGYSDKNPGINQSFSARGLMLDQFIRQEFPGREWFLVGHSMGGGVVQALGLMTHEELSGIVFVDGALFESIDPGESKVPFIFRSAFARGVLLTVFKPFLVNRVAVGRMLTSAYGRKATREEVNGYLIPLKKRGTARGILASAAYSSEIAILKADSLTIPVLALWGDRDTWVPMDRYIQGVHRMKQFDVHIIPGAAHCPMETHPEVLLVHLLEFFHTIRE